MILLQKIKQFFCKKNLPDIISYIFLVIIVCIYAYIQITNFTSAYQEVDPDGYLWLAKRMAEFKPLAVKDDDIFMYQSHVWVENKEGGISPKFAPGYPFLMSFAYRLGGDTAMFWVSPIMGGLALIGSFFLFRMWMSRVSSLFGVFLLAVNGMILVYCNYLLTHATDLCFAVWGMFFLWRWKRGIGKFSNISAGILLGYAITVRHASFLMVTVLISAVVLKWIESLKLKKAIPLKDTAILIGCYCVFPLMLAIYNWAIYDSPFVTGYGLSGEQLAFKWKNISANIRILANGFNYTALFMLFPIGFAGMFLALTFGESMMVVLWVIPLFALYASYYWAPNGMAYFRFLIATFPAFVGSAFAIMDKPSWSWIRKTIVYAVLSGLIIFVTYWDTRSAVENVVSDFPSRSLAYLSNQVSKVLDDDAVIFSRSPAFCYIGTRKHFRHYDLNIFTASYGANSFNENTDPKRHPLRNDRLREFYKGLTDADLQKKKVDLIRKFISEDRQVAYLLQQGLMQGEKGILGDEFQWNLLDSWIAYSKNDGGVWQGETWELYEVKKGKKG
ncbi:TPA: hypothetical protein ENS27_15580 [bacterium]|nr:hypothetical protein [bacterium]